MIEQRTKLTSRGVPVSLTDTKAIAGGPPEKVGGIVSADQSTIIGDGTTENPLRVGSGGTSPTQTTITASGGALLAGEPVYPSGNGLASAARANAIGTSNVSGLAAAAIGNGATGKIQSAGPLTLTTAQWDALTGDVGGLIANDWYYVSAAVAGKLVHDPSAPSSAGQVVAALGLAISATTLNIDIQKPVQL